MGAFNSCFCNAAVLGASNRGGYVDFMDANFYKAAYHVQSFWIPAAILGVLPSAACIAWTLFTWKECGALWKINENISPCSGAEWMRLRSFLSWQKTHPLDWLS